MKIYIVRHGQSEANIPTFKNDKDDCDVELTDLGRKEAFDAGLFLKTLIGKKDFNNSLIITSPYIRTLQTTAEIKKSLPIKTVSDKRIVEFNRGIFERVKYEDRPIKFPKIFYEYRRKMHSPEKFFAKIPQGESGEDVLKRVTPLSYELRRLYKQGTENVIIVCHHDTMRVLIMAIMGYNTTWYNNEKPIQNCSIREIELSENKFRDFGYVYRGYKERKIELTK